MASPFDFDEPTVPQSQTAGSKTSRQLIAEANAQQGISLNAVLGCGLGVFVFLMLIGVAGFAYYGIDLSKRSKEKDMAEVELARKRALADEQRLAENHLNAKEEERRAREAQANERIARMREDLENDRKKNAWPHVQKQNEKVLQDQSEQERRKWIVEDAERRLGTLSAAEYRDAKRCLELVKMYGVDRYGPDTVRKAALIDPLLIEDMQRALAAKRAMKK